MDPLWTSTTSGSIIAASNILKFHTWRISKPLVFKGFSKGSQAVGLIYSEEIFPVLVGLPDQMTLLINHNSLKGMVSWPKARRKNWEASLGTNGTLARQGSRPSMNKRDSNRRWRTFRQMQRPMVSTCHTRFTFSTR